MSDEGSVIIHVGGVETKITHLTFHRYAKEYFNVARPLRSDTTFSPVPYFLVCRSLELALKSFIRAKDVSVEDIKRIYGHNLVKLLNMAKELGIEKHISLTESVEMEISKANDYYDEKEFEYFGLKRVFTGYPNLPDLAILRDFTEELITKLEDVLNKY